MGFTNTLWFHILIISCSIIICKSCSCLMTTDEDLICKADYVVVGKVIRDQCSDRDGTYCLERSYKMKPTSVIKMPPGIIKSSPKRPSRKIFLVSAGDSAMCGIYLEKNYNYVVAGPIYEKNKLTADLCSTYIQRNPTKESLDALENTLRNCNT